MKVRTRFAPSPTGQLHIGSARTALFSWLYARHHQGSFILRIEDTDQARSTPEYVEAIIEAMKWLGMDADEGPFYQMQRMARYRQVAQELLQAGKAYRCYCSKERLATLRAGQGDNPHKLHYDGHCRDNPPTENTTTDRPFVLRFANPRHGEVVFNDGVYGEIIVKNDELDDFIIMRSDGVPTYNFTVVVDDADMDITHVIRGNDHISNTPRQINLLRALGAKLPEYAHLPMLLGEDGKRLSKRHGAQSVLAYREMGYLPAAVLNYLVRLGWSHGDQEIFSVDEMIAHFSIAPISKSPARLNADKLLWLNQHYLSHTAPPQLANHLRWYTDRLGIQIGDNPPLDAIIALQQSRVKTLQDMAEQVRYFYNPVDIDEKARAKHLKPPIIPVLTAVRHAFESLAVWEADAIHGVIVNTAEQFDLKLGKLAQPIRVAVTGGTVSPSIDKTLALLGRERVLRRLQTVIQGGGEEPGEFAGGDV